MIGKTFGRWTVKKFWGVNKWHVKFWICQCECGTEKKVGQAVLRNGQSKSCGCLQAEIMSKRMTKHGRCNDPINNAWRQMIQRCTNKNNAAYPRYGGRGIKIEDKRWFEFANFLEDMGEKPTVKHSIDRIDNNKGYCKENCRWATATEQVANRGYLGKVKYIDLDGRLLTLSGWAEEFKVTEEYLANCLFTGMTIKEVAEKYLKK